MSDQQAVPDLAGIMQQILEILQDHEQRIGTLAQAHGDLDKEIHEDFFGPIHESYMQAERGKGIESLKGKYGSMFEDLAEPLKGFGIEDLFSTLYDHLEALKKTKPDWTDEMVGPELEGIRNKALERIGMIRGKPEEKEAKAEEKPAAAVAVEVKSKPESMKDKLSAGKRRMSMLDSM